MASTQSRMSIKSLILPCSYLCISLLQASSLQKNCRAFFFRLIFLSPIPITFPRRRILYLTPNVLQYDTRSCSLVLAVIEYDPVGLHGDDSFAGSSVSP